MEVGRPAQGVRCPMPACLPAPLPGRRNPGAHPCPAMRKAALSREVMVMALQTKNSVLNVKSSSSRKLKSRDCRSWPSAS